VKLIKTYAEFCFTDFYYDSKVTVSKNVEYACYSQVRIDLGKYLICSMMSELH